MTPKIIRELGTASTPLEGSDDFLVRPIGFLELPDFLETSCVRVGNMSRQTVALLLLFRNVMKMQTSNARRAEAQTVCLLRWVLHRGSEVVTCQVDAHLDRPAYDVCIVPHWDVDAAAIEVVETPSGAFQRHAEIAMRLRNAGWFVTTRSSPASC